MIPLFLIFSKEIFKLFFLFHLRALLESVDITRIVAIWLILQVFFSSISGYISDKNYRKMMLIIMSIASIFALYFLYAEFVLLAIIIDGMLANITPVARAAYCDLHQNKSRLNLMTNTFIAQSLPWIIFCINDFVIQKLYLCAMIFSIISICFLVFGFKDKKDKKKEFSFKEIKDLKFKFFKSTYIKLLIAFLFLEITYQIMPYFTEESFKQLLLNKEFLLLGIGVFSGSLFHKFFKIEKIHKAINLIILFSFLLFFFEFLSGYILEKKFNVPFNMYLLYSFLGGLYWPLIYAFYSEKSKIHEEGLVFGVLESVQSLAEFLPSLLFLTPFLKNFVLSYWTFLIFLGSSFFLTIKKGFYIKKRLT